MFCLVYRSKANPIFGLLQIQQMLEKAREHNERNEITGCLLIYNGQFIQYLEGNQVKVLQLFDKIQNDIRHTDVDLLSHEIIGKREFEKWNMAFENLRNLNSHFEYLKLLVGTFIEDSETSLPPNPTTRKFWQATRLLLETKSSIEQG